MVCKTTPSTQNKVISLFCVLGVVLQTILDDTLFCVLGVVLQTILDVYNYFTCIVSLYRYDRTPRKIDR